MKLFFFGRRVRKLGLTLRHFPAGIRTSARSRANRGTIDATGASD